MLGMAGETPFDLRFSMFGIPVRVHPAFWLLAAFIAWHPPNPAFTFLGVMCVLASLLVHELGHALTTRYFRWHSEIVLYWMGGYATGGQLLPKQRLLMILAGPFSGLAFFGITFGLALLMFVASPDVWQYEAFRHVINILIFINIFWSLMNLTPVFPLDGGQALQSVLYITKRRDPDRLTFLISAIAAGTVAGWSLLAQSSGLYFPIPQFDTEGLYWGGVAGGRFMTFLFGYLCAVNVIQYRNLNSLRGR